MRRRPGIGGLQKAAAARDQYRLLGENVAKLRTDMMKEQLSTFRSQLEEFARKHKNDIRKNPAFRAQFHEMCANIGVDPLASNKGFWAELLGIGDFYYELGVQIIEVCMLTRSHNGGLISLQELCNHLRQRRKKDREAVTEDDCLRAISKLKVLGSGFEVITTGKKKLVRSVPTELNKDHNQILELAQKPSWEKAAKQIKERYDPEMDGRVILAKVDCTQEGDLCRRNHIQGYPSIRIFRKGSDLKDDNAHHDHESYYGDRDTESLVKMVVSLVEPIHLEPHNLALEDKSDNSSRTLKKAPSTGGCRVEGYMRVKKVPGNLMVSARSGSHSFDSSQMNMSHVVNHLSFGRRIMPQKFSEFKRLSPYLGLSHDRLDGRSFINQRDLGPNVTIEHYLQIVKTEVVKSNGQALVEAYEYTAHSSVAHSYYLPVAKFHFELSPMQVLITENTNVCAIIGGVFTVAGILDSILHDLPHGCL